MADPGSILGAGSRPGMMRVLDASGTEREIPAAVLSRLGLRADLAAGDAAVEAMQPAAAPQMADNTGIIQAAQGTLATPPPARRPRATVDVGEPTMMDAAAGGAMRGAQDVLAGATGMGRTAQSIATGLEDAGAAVDARVASVQAAQDAASADADAAMSRVSQERMQTADRYQQLTVAAAQGDMRARLELDDMAMSGDQRAIDARRRAQVMQQTLAAGGGGGGSGGARVTRTATTRLREQARPTTEAEAEELQAAAAEQDRAEREGMVALARESEAEAGALADTAAAMQSAQSQLDALERRRQQAEAARQQEMMRRQRALDTEAGRVGSMELDPTRMFAKGETRNRFSAAIGILLGGLADAVRGGDAGLNTALGIINGAIDRDIDAQRGNVSIAQQGIAQKRGLLDDMRATFGDQQAAEDATRATMLEGVERQIQQLRLSASSDAQRAALDRMIADIQAQKAAARQAAVLGGIPMTDIVIEQRQQAGGGGARRPAPIEDLPDTGVLLTERRALAAEDTAIDETVRSLDRMTALLDEGALVGPIAGRLPGRSLSANAREFDRLATQLTMQMREDVLGPGTVTESEREMLFSAVGLQSTLPSEDVARVVRGMRDRLLRKRASTRRSVGQDAVVESERRAPIEREAVTRQSGDLATELGGRRR